MNRRTKTRKFAFKLAKVILLQAVLTPMALLQAEEVLDPDTSTINWDCRWVDTASESASVIYCMVNQ